MISSQQGMKQQLVDGAFFQSAKANFSLKLLFNK